MKLANVKVEYSCGTTITDRVTLDPATGQVHLPPRLQTLLRAMDETECAPSFVVEYNGSTLPVTVDSNGLRKIGEPDESKSGFEQLLNPRGISVSRTPGSCIPCQLRPWVAWSATFMPHPRWIRRQSLARRYSQ